MSLETHVAIPDALRVPLSRRDFSALLQGAEDLAKKEPSTISLALWQIASQDRSREALQSFSYCLVRALRGPVAEAGRLWLLLNPIDDLSTLVNILTGLDVLVVEENGLPDYQMSVLPEFLSRCLEHSEPSVRISVLDFLRNYVGAIGLPRRFGRAASLRLARQLAASLSQIVQEEEVDELTRTVAGLESDAIPVRPPIRLTAVNEVISALESVPHAEELASVVRVQRLRDDAKRQAQHDVKPILTVRVWENEGISLLNYIRQIFDLCRYENVDPTDKVWLTAPAASHANHLRAREATIKEAFEHFRLASRIAQQRTIAEDGLAALLPRQAQAVARMLKESSATGSHAEFMLTSEFGDQELFLFGSSAESSASWEPTVSKAESRAKEQPEIYSDEVPQANTVRQVIQAVEAICSHGQVGVSDIENINTSRQVDYYTSAARTLGFLQEDNRPTTLGRSLHRHTHEGQMAISADAFRRSMVGQAWMAWAKVDSMSDVKPATADRFLQARAIGISGSTIPRRASTLRKWQSELLPFYR